MAFCSQLPAKQTLRLTILLSISAIVILILTNLLQIDPLGLTGYHFSYLRPIQFVNEPLWSWDLARSCCDVYPKGEKDSSYLQNPIQNNSIVYVKITDFSQFLDKFLSLPATFRVTVVSGMDDFGPLETFSKHSRLGGAVAEKVSFERFLQDDRLLSWFAQNYDLGCSPITGICLDETAVSPPSRRKVKPFPIGIDLHTYANKGDMDANKFKKRVFEQKQELDYFIRESASFSRKSLGIVAAFPCRFKNSHDVRKKMRGELCNLVDAHMKSPGRDAPLVLPCTLKGEEGRTLFWRSMGQFTFALAPVGAGLDTHRFWEILYLRSIPIVLSSPLDPFLVQFPVVIVRQWKDAFNASFLSAAKDRIRETYGIDSRGRLDTARGGMLDRSYWIERVKEGAQ